MAVGFEDATELAGLRGGDSYVVQGLDTDVAKIEAAGRMLKRLGVAGTVSAATFDGKHLPYADNLVNVLVADSLGAVPESEVTRVLSGPPSSTVWWACSISCSANSSC